MKLTTDYPTQHRRDKEGKMPSVHKVPYCGGINKESQDMLKESPIKCRHCGVRISNEDVSDCVVLGVLISRLVISKDSKLEEGIFVA